MWLRVVLDYFTCNFYVSAFGCWKNAEKRRIWPIFKVGATNAPGLVQMDVQNMVLECPGSISFESFMIPPAVVEKMLQNGEYSQISRRRRRMLHILMQICQDGYLKYGFSMSWVHFWVFEVILSSVFEIMTICHNKTL